MGDRSEHSKYPPSSAERRANCPGSVAASETAPHQPSSVWSREGTKAHKVLETALVNQLQADAAWAVLAKQKNVEIGGEMYQFEAVPDDAMLDGVQLTLDHIHEVLPSGIIHAEVRVHFPSAVTDDAWGTSDVRGYEPSTKTLHIIDFKYGVDFVTAFENRQLAQYGVSAFFSDWARGYEIEKIMMTIAQPRNFDDGSKIRSWEATPSDMFVWLDKLEAEIVASRDPNAKRCAGKHCKYCPAEINCPEKQRFVLETTGMTSVQTMAVARPPAPETLDVMRLALILNAKPQIMSWFDNIEKYAHDLARLGIKIPGYKVVEARAKRSWFGDTEFIVQTLQEMTGASLEEIYPRKLLGITAADTLVKKAAKRKGLKAEELTSQMAFLTLKESSGNTALAPETDTRQAIDIAHVSFSNVKQIGE